MRLSGKCTTFVNPTYESKDYEQKRAYIDFQAPQIGYVQNRMSIPDDQAEDGIRIREGEIARICLQIPLALMEDIEFYPPRFIMRNRDNASLRIIDLWTFRSTKSTKRYIVEVEGFEDEFYGLKFYWKGVEKSTRRYSLLTNDYEPRRILRSCIEVMLEYYSANPKVSFGFVAHQTSMKTSKVKRLIKTRGAGDSDFTNG